MNVHIWNYIISQNGFLIHVNFNVLYNLIFVLLKEPKDTGTIYSVVFVITKESPLKSKHDNFKFCHKLIK